MNDHIFSALLFGGGSFWDWGLNSGLCTCKADALPLDPLLQSTFVLVILEMDSHELFAQDWPQTAILPILISHEARIIGMNH
jgi:hypothetical protein